MESTLSLCCNYAAGNRPLLDLSEEQQTHSQVFRVRMLGIKIYVWIRARKCLFRRFSETKPLSYKRVCNLCMLKQFKKFWPRNIFYPQFTKPKIIRRGPVCPQYPKFWSFHVVVFISRWISEVVSAMKNWYYSKYNVLYLRRWYSSTWKRLSLCSCKML